ncbi:MAG TPA: hypothetical protein VIX63_06315, partial [Vicinamibacterales bacterium]
LMLALTGGFVVTILSIRVSSRNPRNAVLIALLSGLAAWALPAPRDRRGIRETWIAWNARIRKLQSRWSWRRDAAAMIALVGIALEVHLWAISRPLWVDEEMIALNLRDRSLADLAGPLWLGQSAPYGWLALQRAILLTLGAGELALRLVPLLFGIATLLAAVWAGRRWAGPIGAPVLVLLCTFGRWISHYPNELKHYSADTFWGLALPALAIYSMEAESSTARMRRAVLWWAAASVGLWFANGALFAAPACALVLLIAIWRRAGGRAAMLFALAGGIWLASFSLHFIVALRHTVRSEFLRNFWMGGLPPATAGWIETLSWLTRRFEPVATDPVGTDLWVLLWLVAACGFALSVSRPLGVILAAMTVSAFPYAALRLVPLQARLALWIVPAVYMGIAIFCDSAVRFTRNALVRRRWTRLLLAGGMTFLGFSLCVDISRRGLEDYRHGRPRDDKQGLDDRAAVHWLMLQSRPGDAWMTTRLAMPAIWWYGGMPLTGADSAGGRDPNGGPIFEVGYSESESECRQHALDITIRGQRRVLVYSGFPDVPDGFDDLLLGRLAALGTLREHRRFAVIGRAAVFDLTLPATPDDVAALPPLSWRRAPPPRLGGCVVARPAKRW